MNELRGFTTKESICCFQSLTKQKHWHSYS